MSMKYLIVLLILSVGCAKEDPAVRAKLDKEKPIGTEVRLRHEVVKSLGKSNREVKRIHLVVIDSGKLTISFRCNDNFTDGMIRLGIQMDIEGILKAAKRSGHKISVVFITGSFPLSNKFGQSKEVAVINAKFSGKTINKINWDRFSSDNLGDISDGYWLHPVLQ